MGNVRCEQMCKERTSEQKKKERKELVNKKIDEARHHGPAVRLQASAWVAVFCDSALAGSAR